MKHLTAMAICLIAIGVLGFTYILCAKWSFKLNSWTLPVGAAIFFPPLLVLVYQSGYLHIRHFIISMAFLLILIGLCLAALFERSRVGAMVCLIFLASFVVANTMHTRKLLAWGRGSYSTAIHYMQQNSSGNAVTVSGDHPFRIPFTISFYAPLSKIPKEIRYFNLEELPAGGPEWMIFHNLSEGDDSATPPPQMSDVVGNRYVLTKDYPAAPLSGLHWFIYHNLSKIPSAQNTRKNAEKYK